MTADQFTVDGATSTNAANSGVITAVFPVAVNTSTLTTAIGTDNSEATNAVVGIATGDYAQTELDTYKAAITAAQAVANNTSATQSDVDSAVITLATAKTTFDSVITVTGEATVVNGQALQLGIDVTPTYATNKTVTWVLHL